MSRLLDDDQELETQQRELTLSTAAILAIFLGLVLLCAVFFGFGYNLGRRSTTTPTVPPVPTANEDQPATTNSSPFDNFKPSPASPPSSAPAAAPAAASTPPPVTATVETQPRPAITHTTPAAPSHPAPTVAAPTAAAAPPPATHTPAAPQTAPGGSFVVQIAAISTSHKDDADLLVTALHNKGYDVAEHTGQDKLIHIQVGPFTTKADAEAMRERLIIDGYNAIVK
jgi:DedD protein